MRFRYALLVCIFPAAAAAQVSDAQARKDALKWALAQQDQATGAFKVEPKGKPSLRACNGAVRAIKYLGGELPQQEKVAKFVLACYDPATGAFAEPGGRPDVAITSIGVMAAAELGIPKEKYHKAMDYLKEHAKTFEEVRISAAAVEAWGVKDCPFDLTPWLRVADEKAKEKLGDPADGGAREAGSLAAFRLRLGRPLPHADAVEAILRDGQRADGGWGKAGEKGSDLDSTYRVMRAFHLMREKPKDVAGLRKFLLSCRNADGGFGVKPGEPSSMSGVYYFAIISKWLDEMK
jgi:prenyltransferase beta subunit